MKYRTFLLLTCLLAPPASAGVPAAQFFTQPDYTSANLSPDGQRVAAIRYRDGVQLLEVRAVADDARRLLVEEGDIPGREATIRAWDWIDNRHIIFQVTAVKKGIEDLLDTRTSSQWFVADVGGGEPVLKQILTRGWLVDPLPAEPGKFLFAKSGSYSKVYRIDTARLSAPGKLNKLAAVDGGQFVPSNEVCSVEGYAVRWFFDRQGEVRAALHFDREGELSLSTFGGEGGEGGAELIHRWTDSPDGQEENRRVIPVALAGETGKFYGLDFNEEEERSIYLLDFARDTEKLVRKVDSYKIVDLILSPEDGTLIGARTLRNATLVDEYFRQVEGVTPSVRVSGDEFTLDLDRSSDDAVRLQYREGHDLPGQYLLRFRGSQQPRRVGSQYPALSGKIDSRLVEDRVEVEGLEIPYLLTLPAGPGKFPLIVLPHGGPVDVFDDRNYDPITQYFAAAGYAVLRVNFRGSSGYSEALKEAGKKQWGGLILEDIYRATLAVTGRREVDANRVCALGISYGGYASAMLSILHPELYRCAASVAGVTDVNLMLNSPRLSERQVEWTREYVGDPVREYEQLKAISPVYLAERFTRPLLIAHGGEDKVVDPEHSHRLKLMLQRLDKPFEWYFEPGVGHDFGGAETKAALFTRLKSFVDTNLAESR